MKNILISMIGLEERVLGAISSNDITADKYLLFINEEFKDDKRVVKYRNILLGEYINNKEHDICYCSYHDSMKMIQHINQYFLNNDIDVNVTNLILDMSTFNRQNLLVLLWLLRIKYKVKKIEIVYTVPKIVNPVLTKGASGFSTIPFFSGSFSLNKKKMLILLMGYEVDRPLLLYRESEPSIVVLATGEEPTDQIFLQRNKDAVIELKSETTNSYDATISANDPLKARDQISEIVGEYKDRYNIIVSPLNTKLQTLGLYLAWELNKDIQIVITSPDSFSEWLTEGIKETKRFTI